MSGHTSSTMTSCSLAIDPRVPRRHASWSFPDGSRFRDSWVLTDILMVKQANVKPYVFGMSSRLDRRRLVLDRLACTTHHSLDIVYHITSRVSVSVFVVGTWTNLTTRPGQHAMLEEVVVGTPKM